MQKNRISLFAFILILTAAGLLAACTKTPAALAPTPTPATLSVSPAQAHAAVQQGVYVLDVRSQEEWDQFHIAGSTLIPLEKLPSRLGQLPKDRAILVVCLSGVRSQSGAALLQQAGFTQVSYMSGGLQAWIKAGYPVEGISP